MSPTLTYVHDPMCSWCYAFRPVWEAVVSGLPDEVQLLMVRREGDEP